MLDARTCLMAAILSSVAVAGAQSKNSKHVKLPDGSSFRSKYVQSKNYVRLEWSGKIRKPMARLFRDEINKWRANPNARSLRFLLRLNSGGGKVKEAGRVIKVLQKLKRTNRLRTSVRPGRKCGSSCVPIFLQGHDRLASSASLWLFHEVSRSHPKTKKLLWLDQRKTKRFFNRFFLPAGVPEPWLNDLLPRLRNQDVWMTGKELFESRANIITRLVGNTKRRNPKYAEPRPEVLKRR